jgi:DNA-binding beta-propeller fold protein YncE
MVMDSHGRILVTDPGLSVVHVFDIEQRKRWQFSGGFRQGLVTPAYIAVDANDHIYVTDLRRSAVLVFQPNGRLLRTIGAGILNMPTGVWVDKAARTLYVADRWRGQVLLFDLEGRLLGVIGTPGGGPGQLYGPGDIVIHGDTLVVLDSINSRFELFDLQGNFRATWPFGHDRTPIAFAFDAADHLYYVDMDSGALVAMDLKGKVLARLGPLRSFGHWAPRRIGTSFMCVAIDPLGDILALRPTLHIETVKLAPDATENAP